MSGPDGNRDDGFLRRWSRLKREDRPAAPDLAEENALGPADGTNPPESEAAVPDEAAIADLPDIDSLDKDSDYTVFLRDGVPEALRQRALRKLWLSDPVLANLDGLNDYDGDFGAVLRDGAAYMKRLADAGERLTRPGAEDDAPEAPVGEDAEDEKEDAAADVAEARPAEGIVGPAAPDNGKTGEGA